MCGADFLLYYLGTVRVICQKEENLGRLELTLLGPFHASLDGEAITAFKSNKVRALLAYLAVEADRPQRREALAALLWPDWPARSAMNNLRFTLADLRRSLKDRQADPPFLLITRESIQFNRASDSWVDLAEFEHSAVSSQPSAISHLQSEINDLQSAISICKGEFLEGFSLPDDSLFEEWLAVEREQVKRRRLGALQQLSDAFTARGENEKALAYARQGLALEPWLEEGHQRVMRLLALSGQRGAALAQYEACRRLLAKELGVEPGVETARLYEAIRDGTLENRRGTTQPGPKHNLPSQLTHFIGREQEIAQVKKRLAEWRLVTLTGSGGVGKTRLALQVAEDILEDYPNGVWFVDFAPLSDPALVAQQVAVTLGLREEPNRPILDSLASFLCARQILLVPDNCEHLLEACARLVDTLLRACPRLKILTTSREPLGVAGEAIFRVPSLPFPDPDRLPSMEKLNEYTSLSLFVDRARLALPDYQVTPQNAPSLARICQRLDGIPLAIELAAARADILTAEQLAGRLDDAFRLLTGGSRTALPRQQTLRATIDWSYNMLSEKERLLFQRLSVFAGGCTLEATEAGCAGEGLETGEVLDLLAALVDRSMLIADRRSGEEARYRLLETVRQYAREKLQDSGESARLHTRHRDYYLAFIEANAHKLFSKDRLLWTRKLEAEHENMRLALEWSFSDLTDVEAGPRFVLEMYVFWMRGYLQEAYDWFKRGIVLCQSHPEISPSLYASFLGLGSHLIAFHDPKTAFAWGNQAIEISRRLDPGGKGPLIGSLLILVWTTMWDLDDVEQALPLFAEAEALFQELDPDQYSPEFILSVRAWLAKLKAGIANKQGRYQDAKAYASESIRLYEQFNDPEIIWSLTFLGEAFVNLGEYNRACDQYLEALRVADELGDNRKSFVLRSLGMVDFRQGNLDRALAYCQEGLRLAYEVPDYNNVATCLGLAACILAKQGEQAGAARLSGAAKVLYERQGRKPMEDSSLDTILPGWREQPEQETIMKGYEEGTSMTVDQAVAFALSLSIA